MQSKQTETSASEVKVNFQRKKGKIVRYVRTEKAHNKCLKNDDDFISLYTRRVIQNGKILY